MTKDRILIIGSANYSNRRIKKELINLGMKAAIAPVKNFTLSISESNGHDKIYYNSKRVHAKYINGIIPRIGKGLIYGSAVVRQFEKNLNVFNPSSAEGLLIAMDKYKTTQVLSKARISVPKTAYFTDVKDYKFATDLVGGLPCVAKLISGSQGKGVFILTDALSGSTALKTILLSQKVILQQFIESASQDENKCDIRAWVVNGEVVASMKRFAVDSDFRSNYSISKNAEKVELTDDEKILAIRSAKAVGLDLCGVDLMRDINTKKTYVIECNSNASLYGIEKVTGINVASKIAKYMKLVTASDPNHKSMSVPEVDSDAYGHYYNIDRCSYQGLSIGSRVDGIQLSREEIFESTESSNTKPNIPSYLQMSYDMIAQSSLPHPAMGSTYANHRTYTESDLEKWFESQLDA